jgi:hypothetical protein
MIQWLGQSLGGVTMMDDTGSQILSVNSADCVNVCARFGQQPSITKYMRNDSPTWAGLQATGMLAHFHVLIDVNH